MVSQLSPNAKRAILFGATAIIIYLAMILGTLAQLEKISGLTPFDMRPVGYGPEDANALLTALGETGRAYYLNRQLLLDALYPALLALTLSSLYRLLGTGVPVRLVQVGVVASWLAAAFDYAENSGIAAMLQLWPDIPDILVSAASLATIAKSLMTSLAVTGLLVLFGRKIWLKTREFLRPGRSIEVPKSSDCAIANGEDPGQSATSTFGRARPVAMEVHAVGRACSAGTCTTEIAPKTDSSQVTRISRPALLSSILPFMWSL